MDRRKKRTSTNQYMMYIEMMEKDSIFATGRVPRDVDVNYLHKRWKNLSDKLNTCSSGPNLTAEEWRKVAWGVGWLANIKKKNAFLLAPKWLEKHNALQISP